MGEHKILKPAKPVAEITIIIDSAGQADVRAFDTSGARIQNGVLIPGRVKMPPLNCAAYLSQVLSGIMAGIMAGLANQPPGRNTNNGDDSQNSAS